MPYKRQKTTRSNKKNGIYDLMTDLGLGVFIPKKTNTQITSNAFTRKKIDFSLSFN